MIGKNKNCFDPALGDLSENDNIGAFVRAGTDGDAISSGDGDSDNVANTFEGLDTRGFLYGYDGTGDNWDRLRQTDGALHVLADLDVDFDFVHAEDSAHTSGDLGSFSLSVRIDDLSVDNSALLAGTNGDYQGTFTNAKGELYTIDTDANASLDAIETDIAAIEVELLDQGTTLDAMAVDLAAIEVELLDQGTTLDSIDGKITLCDDRIKVVDTADGTVKTTQKDATTTQGAMLASALADRQYLYVQNCGNRAVYLAEAGATDAAATGIKLECGSIAEFRFGSSVGLDIEAVGGTQDLRIMEVGC